LVKRSITISTRWELDTIEEIEKILKTPKTPDGKFANVSLAIRECTKIGIKVHNYQEMMKDPEKANEFRIKMQEMVQNEEVFDWVQTLSPDQIDGFLMALQMQKDNRYKLEKLL
jgi:hypothetical protein